MLINWMYGEYCPGTCVCESADEGGGCSGCSRNNENKNKKCEYPDRYKNRKNIKGYDYISTKKAY